MKHFIAGLAIGLCSLTASALTLSPTTVLMAPNSTTTVKITNATGEIQAESKNTAVVTVSLTNKTSTSATLVLSGKSIGSTAVYVRDPSTQLSLPVNVTSSVITPPPTTAKYSLLAWNDLGMHCVDGVDYSMFSILPPFNNLHAQLVNATTGKKITTGITLTYEAVADPAGSINTTSAGKTNFWSWAPVVYGAILPTDVGLTGNYTPSRTPRVMKLEPTNGWFEATGLPITPVDDLGYKNYYPTVKVVAKDVTGKVLASSVAVLPVSDEITCITCHASTSSTNTAKQAARPKSGWANDPNLERDWKKNILIIHDEKQWGNQKYIDALNAKGLNMGLYQSAMAGKPALCATCHASNALPGTGIVGVSALTSAVHANHGKVIDPITMTSMNSSTNRSACYSCHPGSATKCLRGAMSNVADVQCQSCHGNMAKVGDATRVGWLQQPTCQACHYNGKRFTSAVTSTGDLIKPADTRFATNPNVPAAGFNLYRFSKGHGGMQCEACHGSTHAEYPSVDTNDNIQSIALQGYKGTVRECKTCHVTVPMTTAGGPHGLHTLGQAWVQSHGDRVESTGATACAYCHGADYRGTGLSQTPVTRTFTLEGGIVKTIPATTKIGCYTCHNGPNP